MAPDVNPPHAMRSRILITISGLEGAELLLSTRESIAVVYEWAARLAPPATGGRFVLGYDRQRIVELDAPLWQLAEEHRWGRAVMLELIELPPGETT